MMRTHEIQQRFNHVEGTIHQAAERCRQMTSVPMDLKDCIQQLDQQAMQAHEMMSRTDDQNQMMQCIDDLESLGDRARDACERSGAIDGQLRSAVMQVHSELSDLKHQLH